MNWGNLIDTSTLAGWVRAATASGLTYIMARWPLLSSILDPATQAAIGAAASGIVVGAWSHIAKAKS